jgi:primosomal protein N' (replication factor Y)
MSTEQKKDILFADVVFPLPVDHAFTYEIPETFRDLIKPGHRVLCPFGNRKLTGFVVGLKRHTDLTDWKEIEDVLDEEPVFSDEMLRLARWVADYYLASWGEVLDAALPPGIAIESRRRVVLSEHLDQKKVLELEDVNPKQRKLLQILARKGGQLIRQLETQLGQTNLRYNLMTLQRKGYLHVIQEIRQPSTRAKLANFVRLSPEIEDVDEIIQEFLQRHERQAEILKALRDHPEGIAQTDLLRRLRMSSSALKSLQKKGLVVIEKREVFRDYYAGFEVEKIQPLQLTDDQITVLAELERLIAGGKFAPVLLYGVTGSGKTQVYIEALHKIRQKGKTGIVLVPEIALTPQTVSRFRAHFGDEVAVLHSRMSHGERYDSWRRIREGKIQIVIGPRSAIFAPLEKIGIIIVDEEHEASYKQDDPSPRYNARDVALYRGKMNDAVVILGSATPSLESFHNARTGKYRLLELPRRVEDLPLPSVEVVDMRKEWKETHGQPSAIFSRILLEKIAERLTHDEQIILLQNRRGFSTFILCRDCGHVETCPNCNITLTFHIDKKLLRCHYCDFQKKAPGLCPQCNGIQLQYRGTGTQRVEEELKMLFPSARIVRMDLDTTRRKGAHDQILRDFRDGEYDILLGTQMVAKGLDFPKVTLVGVISADTSLHLPDFRAAEKTFQLLTQVAGRSGRKGKQGEVVIQTFHPENHSILFAKKHDYLRFYARESSERKELAYPPYSRLISVEFRGTKEDAVQNAAIRFAKRIPKGTTYRTVGPAPAPISRLKGEFRYRLLIKWDRFQDPSGKEVHTALRQALEDFGRFRQRGLKITVDVDPMNLF